MTITGMASMSKAIITGSLASSGRVLFIMSILSRRSVMAVSRLVLSVKVTMTKDMFSTEKD